MQNGNPAHFTYPAATPPLRSKRVERSRLACGTSEEAPVLLAMDALEKLCGHKSCASDSWTFCRLRDGMIWMHNHVHMVSDFVASSSSVCVKTYEVLAPIHMHLPGTHSHHVKACLHQISVCDYRVHSPLTHCFSNPIALRLQALDQGRRDASIWPVN